MPASTPRTERIPSPTEAPEIVPPPPGLSANERALHRVNQAFNSLGYNVRCTLRESAEDTGLAENTIHYGYDSCGVTINPDAFKRLRERNAQSTIDAVFGHEIGHTLLSMSCGTCTNGHSAELFSDYLAGCLLATLGTSEEEAYAASFYFGSLSSGKTHPHGADREAILMDGFHVCERSLSK